MRPDDLVEPGVVLIDRVPDLDHRDAAVFRAGVVSNEAIRFLLRRHRSRGDLVVHVSVTQDIGGHKLAQAFGYVNATCTNASQTATVRVTDFGVFAFKKGNKAIASADLTQCNADGSVCNTTASIVGQSITIK